MEIFFYIKKKYGNKKYWESDIPKNYCPENDVKAKPSNVKPSSIEQFPPELTVIVNSEYDFNDSIAWIKDKNFKIRSFGTTSENFNYVFFKKKKQAMEFKLVWS